MILFLWEMEQLSIVNFMKIRLQCIVYKAVVSTVTKLLILYYMRKRHALEKKQLIITFASVTLHISYIREIV